MVAQKGRDFLLKVESSAGSGTYNTIGGGRAHSVKYNSETVDITNKDSSGWQTLLDGAGTMSVEISASGVFYADTPYTVVRTAMINNDIINFRVSFPTYTMTGQFQITSLEEGGEHNGEVTYTMSLASSGTLTIV